MKKITEKIIPCLVFCVCLFAARAGAVEIRLTAGAHDFMVSNITPSSIYDGSTSHTFGINAGANINHTTASGIVLGGYAEFYLEHNKDKLDPDHSPLWYRFNVYGHGPITSLGEKLDLLWHIDLRNKQNTVSGVEREIKNFYGLGLAYDREKYHLALNGYGGFFYLEIDDDAPRAYAGYDREDLDNGTSAISLMLDGSLRLSENVELLGYLQNWTSIGVGSDWLENEIVLEMNFKTPSLASDSKLHVRVTHTRYNLDGYYREDLGRPVLPWDNDTLIRVYLSLPWGV